MSFPCTCILYGWLVGWSVHLYTIRLIGWLKCCFTSTETVGLLGTGAQDVHLDFHTPPELWLYGSFCFCFMSSERCYTIPSLLLRLKSHWCKAVTQLCVILVGHFKKDGVRANHLHKWYIHTFNELRVLRKKKCLMPLIPFYFCF